MAKLLEGLQKPPHALKEAGKCRPEKIKVNGTAGKSYAAPAQKSTNNNPITTEINV